MNSNSSFPLDTNTIYSFSSTPPSLCAPPLHLNSNNHLTFILFTSPPHQDLTLLNSNLHFHPLISTLTPLPVLLLLSPDPKRVTHLLTSTPTITLYSSF